MKKQTMIHKDLSTKKVGMFSLKDLTNAVVWLKPGTKVKYDDHDTRHYYLDKFGEIPYRKIYYNGQEGYIVAEAIE